MEEYFYKCLRVIDCESGEDRYDGAPYLDVAMVFEPPDGFCVFYE